MESEKGQEIRKNPPENQDVGERADRFYVSRLRRAKGAKRNTRSLEHSSERHAVGTADLTGGEMSNVISRSAGERKADRAAIRFRVCGLLAALAAASSCAVLEEAMQRSGYPDDRVQLGPRDTVSVYHRDIVKYTCPSQYLLSCGRSGAITVQCFCSLR